MPADALWAFCMALNIYLAFHTTISETKFRKLGYFYMLACYGIPFVPALVFLLLDVFLHMGFYGDATVGSHFLFSFFTVQDPESSNHASKSIATEPTVPGPPHQGAACQRELDYGGKRYPRETHFLEISGSLIQKTEFEIHCPRPPGFRNKGLISCP